MIITISGLAGSGKTTVGKALAEKLMYKFYDIGTFRKKMAAERGMTIEEFNKLGETESFTDKDADSYLENLGKTEDNFVVQGRLAYYFIPYSVKVFLNVSLDKAAQRIKKDSNNPERNSESQHSPLEIIRRLSKDRDDSDKVRYKKWYGIENYRDPKHYDLVIDTSNITAEQVVQKIVDCAKSKSV